MLDKLKQLSKDTAVYGISTMVGRFLNFLLVPFYTNIFLPAEYGIITNIYAFIGILNIFFLYGMDSAFLRYAGMERENNKDNFSTSYISVFLSSIVFAGLFLLFQFPIMNLMGVPEGYHYLVYIIALVLFFDAVAAIPFIKLRLDKKAKKFAAFKVINIIVNVGLNLFLILVLKWGIDAVFISNLIASLVSFLLVLGVIQKNIHLKFRLDFLKKLLKFGIPYLPAGLAAMLIQVIDRPILEHLTDLTTLGIYQANYKLGIFMMLFVNMFQFAWQPFFLQEAKSENAKEIFSKVLTYFAIISSVILIILSLFIDNLVTISVNGRSLIGSAYWSGLNIVPVILLAYIFNGFYVIFTAGVFIKEKSIYVPFVVGLGAVINIAINFLLIPVWGIMGAAFATLASYLTMAVSLYIITQRVYKIEYEVGKIIRIFSIILIEGIIYYNLLNSGNLNLIYKFILLISFFILLLIFAVDKKEFNFIKTRILKQNR